MKKGSYRQLNDHDRVRIEVYLSQGKSQYAIAKLLGVHKSTISREIQKRGGLLRGYTAEYAQQDYEASKKSCGVKRKIENHPIGRVILDRLRGGWSPEVIAGRLKKEIREGKRPADEYVNHESIYRFIYESDYGKRENLRMYLRQGKRRRTRRSGRKTKHQIIPNRIFIDERPEEVATRTIVGHWEGDTIMYGRKRGINSLIERKTRYVILTKLKDKTPTETESAVIRGLKNQFVKTITFDNGIENRNHQEMTDVLQAKIYFCHPYHSWEKGSNEHANGIVRRYLPKKTDLAIVTQRDVDDIAWEINNRPRKILKFSTPEEMLELEYLKLSVVALNPRI